MQALPRGDFSVIHSATLTSGLAHTVLCTWHWVGWGGAVLQGAQRVPRSSPGVMQDQEGHGRSLPPLSVSPLGHPPTMAVSAP